MWVGLGLRVHELQERILFIIIIFAFFFFLQRLRYNCEPGLARCVFGPSRCILASRAGLVRPPYIRSTTPMPYHTGRGSNRVGVHAGLLVSRRSKTSQNKVASSGVCVCVWWW